MLLSLLAFTAIPRDIPTWDQLEAMYQQPPTPDVVTSNVYFPNSFRQRIRFKSQHGDTVIGWFARPLRDGQFPVVLLLHGLRSNKDNAISAVGQKLLDRGCAFLALDAPHHGDRRSLDDHGLFQIMGASIANQEGDLIQKLFRNDPDLQLVRQLSETIHDGVLDYRACLDYLVTRPDVDPNRIGAIGFSMGAMMAGILASVDERVSCACLYSGGDPYIGHFYRMTGDDQKMLAAVSPSLFVSHMTPRPLLMMNGRNDTVIRPSAAIRLFSQASQPKEIQWFDSGHSLPIAGYSSGADWMAKRLSPVKSRQP